MLIIGVTGFVGSHLAEYLPTRGDFEAYGTYRWRSRMVSIEHIRDRLHLVECDLRRPTGVRRMLADVRPDRVFHPAARSYVPTSWAAPAETFMAKVTCQLNLFEAARELGLHAVSVRIPLEQSLADVLAEWWERA